MSEPRFLGDNKPMLRIDGLKKDYQLPNGTLRKVIDIPSFSFPERGLFAICGPSGCGKTTLLNLLSLFESPTEGKLFLNETDLTSIQGKAVNDYRHRRIGYLDQKATLLPYLNAFENVSLPYRLGSPFPTKEEEDAYIHSLFERFGIKGREKDFPSTLSGGEASRLCLIRALAMKPDILLADEPTAALGKEEAHALMEYVRSVSETSLVLLVSHDEELVKEYASDVFFLRDGNLIGHPKEGKGASSSLSKCGHGRPFFPLAAKRFARSFGKRLTSSMIVGLGVLGISLSLAVRQGTADINRDVLNAMLTRMPLSIGYFYSPVGEDIWVQLDNDRVAKENYVYPSVTDSSPLHINVFDDAYISFLEKDIGKDLYHYENEQVFSMIFPDGEGYRLSSAGQNPSGDDLQAYLNNYLGSKRAISPSIVDYASLPNEHDCLYGRFPEAQGEAFLLVDPDNTVDANVLRLLGASGDKVTFSSIVGREFKFVPDNAIYKKRALTQTVTGRFLKDQSELGFSGAVGVLSSLLDATLSYEEGDVDSAKAAMKEMENYFNVEAETRTLSAYSLIKNESKLGEIYADDSIGQKLKITGILRKKEGVVMDSLVSGLYYSSSLQEAMKGINKDSEISQEICSHLLFGENESLTLNPPQIFSFLDEVKAVPIEDQVTYLRSIYEHFQLRRSFGVNDGPSHIVFDVKTYKEALDIVAKLDAYNADKPQGKKLLYWDYGINSSRTLEGMLSILERSSVGIFFIVAMSNLLKLFLFAVLDARSRKKEIGLYRALGTGRGKIVALFLDEGLLQGLFSGVIGIGLSYLAITLFNRFVQSGSARTIGQFFARFSFLQALAVFGISVALSLFATIVVALIHTRNSPSSSMRD